MHGSAGGEVEPALAAAALERLPDGVGVLDRDWTVRYVNPAGARLLDLPRAELLGRDLREALPGLADTPFEAFLRHARRTGAPVTWQGYHPGTGRWLSAVAEAAGGLLHVSFRAVPPPPAGPGDGDRLLYLAEVSEAMITTLDTGVPADRLAALLVPRLADWATVTVVADEGGPEQTARAHRDPRLLDALDTYLAGRLRGARTQDAVTAALVSGAPVQLTSIDQALVSAATPAEEVREAWRRLDATSCVFVPVRSRGETFGVLSLVNAGDRPPHSAEEIAVAVDVARRAALAFDNARLYRRQVQVAETLQRSLLPPPPAADALRVAVRYRPASSRALVGGDFHDAFRTADGALVAVIGDVAGHNLEAAAAMGRLASTVRALAYDRGDTPAGTLTRVDRVLAGLGPGTLATALVARLEQDDAQRATGEHTLRWSSAGHPPPLVLRADGGVRVLGTTPERLLGVGPPAVLRTDHRAALRSGDVLVLYTDGLLEHGGTSIDEGTDRLAAVLGGLAGRPLEELCDGLVDGVLTGRARDDVAVLAVRVDGVDGVDGW
ncbi:PP2C family protein-serine/threonine phosphatase [Geodermatophilus marinus]|uniref:PP2C family protein-serine/threonine phosphatase n=1 Tax=Geodermatophilus sp. LHW52908 TaxID=2303986 RepID=UPI000E3BA1E8|nr:SpoIIE family protein phosphatase [Geodermatophilus sp. LHW52908]RFU22058.1 GAF domain-containing protein [Geodermatophilus sp. LHW52908]